MKVIVTGANGALGRSVVACFTAKGAHVAALSQDVADDLEAGIFEASDLGDEVSAQNVVGRAAEWLGGVDALVHLVGGFAWAEVNSTRIVDWRAMFTANVETTLATVNASVPHLREGGAIVTVGAAAADRAGAGFGPYGASKSGVARMTEALAAELAPRRIRANAVLPLVIDTLANRADMPDADPMEWTAPQAIAETIRFLASPASRAINGALIPVTNATR